MAEAYVWSRLQQHHQLQQLHQHHQLQQHHHHHHHPHQQQQQQQQQQQMQQHDQQQLHNHQQQQQQQQQHSPVTSSSSLSMNARNSAENINQDILFPPRQFTSGVASVPQTPSPESHQSSPINKSPTTPLSPNQLVVPQPVKPKPASGKSYQCKMCEQRFTTKSEAVQHTRHNHGKEEKRHKCGECVKSFPSTQQLAQHMLVHTNERTHHCEYCEKSFKQLSHLQQHRRRHTGERPYKCPMEGCELAFAQLSNLQQHVRNHANQEAKSASRDYQCEVCKRRFTTLSSLQKHSAKVHIHLVPSQDQMIKEVAEKLSKSSSTKQTKKRKASATTSARDAAAMAPLHYSDLQLRDPNLPPIQQHRDQHLESLNLERPPSITYPDLQVRDPNPAPYQRPREQARDNRDGPSRGDDLVGEGQGLAKGRGLDNRSSFGSSPGGVTSSGSSLPPFSQALSRHIPHDSLPSFPTRMHGDGDPRLPFHHHFPLLLPPDRRHLGSHGLGLHGDQGPLEAIRQRIAESERDEDRTGDK